MELTEIRRRAFVLRVWQDETGHVWGQINEPVNGWRVPFAGIDELWAVLIARLDISARRDTLPPDRPDE